MNTKEIHYINGFFRTVEGSWLPRQYDQFMTWVNTSDKYFVIGNSLENRLPETIAGPFDTKAEAQEALDNFFIKGGMDASR